MAEPWAKDKDCRLSMVEQRRNYVTSYTLLKLKDKVEGMKACVNACYQVSRNYITYLVEMWYVDSLGCRII